jgi:putative peptidoglycan lipid II flippase
MAVLVSPVTAVLYPALAGYEARSDHRGLFRAVDRAVRSVISGMLPVAIGICVLALPVLDLLFEHGRFSNTDTRRVAGILAFYSGILVLGGVGSLLVRGFYAVGNIRDPMIWGGLVPLALNAILDALVFRRFDVYGVAAVTSLNAVVGLPVLYILLRRRLGSDPLGGWTSFLTRSLIAGGAMAYVTHAFARTIPSGAMSFDSVLSIFMAGAIGLMTYGALAYLLRVEPIPELFTRARAALRARSVAQDGVVR